MREGNGIKSTYKYWIALRLANAMLIVPVNPLDDTFLQNM